MFLYNYHYIWLNYISELLHQFLENQEIWPMHLVNGAKFLNVTPLSFSSACLDAVSAPLLLIVIVTFTSMHASL